MGRDGNPVLEVPSVALLVDAVCSSVARVGPTVCRGLGDTAGRSRGCRRPLNTTSSVLLDEAFEAAGDGLRIARCAMAVVLLLLAVGGESGASEASSDSGSLTWIGGWRGFLIVPSSWPALTKCTGWCRSFLPASKAEERWLEFQRASSASEKAGDAAGTRQHGEYLGKERKQRTFLGGP